MTRATFILGLILVMSGSSYAQEITHHDTLPAWDSPLEQQLKGKGFLFKPNENDPPTVSLGEAKIDRVDPGMPIVVPPQDEDSKFLVKVFPKDFPSNMPIAKVPDASPSHEPAKPKIMVIPRNNYFPHP